MRKEQSRRTVWLRSTLAIIIVLAWGAYFGFSFHLASIRIDECGDLPYLDGQQQAMCVRHAIEARDMACLLGFGGPLAAMVIFFIWLNLKWSGQSAR